MGLWDPVEALLQKPSAPTSQPVPLLTGGWGTSHSFPLWILLQDRQRETRKQAP